MSCGNIPQKELTVTIVPANGKGAIWAESKTPDPGVPLVTMNVGLSGGNVPYVHDVLPS